MGVYLPISTLYARLDSYIKNNGTGAITGDILNMILKDLCDTIAELIENSAQTIEPPYIGTFTNADLNSELELIREIPTISDVPIISVYNNLGALMVEMNSQTRKVPGEKKVIIKFVEPIEGTYLLRIDN